MPITIIKDNRNSQIFHICVCIIKIVMTAWQRKKWQICVTKGYHLGKKISKTPSDFKVSSLIFPVLCTSGRCVQLDVPEFQSNWRLSTLIFLNCRARECNFFKFPNKKLSFLGAFNIACCTIFPQDDYYSYLLACVSY